MMLEPAKAKSIRIVIADDHAMVRDGLRRSLEYAGFLVVGEARDGKEAVTLVRELIPGILLLDLKMPGHDGFEALRELSETGHEATRIIVLTADIDAEGVALAIQLGAKGIVMKNSGADLLVAAIKCVDAGGAWVGTKPESNLPTYLSNLLKSTHSEGAARNFGLTRRELQVTSCVVSGRSNKEIAERLGIAEDTVKHHLSNIFNKTGVSTRVELVVFALHHRLRLEDCD